MVGGSIEDQEDILPGKPSRQDIEEALEARRVRCRHDQIDACSVLRTDRAIEVDIFANELRSDVGPDAARCPARPWPVDPAEPRFIGKHDPQPPTASGCRPPCPLYGTWEAAFLKSSWAARSPRG